MCQSMVNIQSPTAEIRRGKKKKKKEEERRNRMKIYMVSLLHRATINQQHIIIRARCTRQFIVYLATWTFQSIQNYLYKLSGKRPLPDTATLSLLKLKITWTLKITWHTIAYHGFILHCTTLCVHRHTVTVFNVVHLSMGIYKHL